MNAYQIAPQSLIQIPRSIVNLAYRAFVRSLPCCCCGRTWGVEFAHTGNRGLSQRATDLDGVPLCRKSCHQTGPHSYHALGRVAFERYHGLDLRKIIAQLQAGAVAAGIDLNRDDTPKKQPGRAMAIRRGRTA